MGTFQDTEMVNIAPRLSRRFCSGGAAIGFLTSSDAGCMAKTAYQDLLSLEGGELQTNCPLAVGTHAWCAALC